MDDRTEVLQKNVSRLLREAAEAKVALDRAEGRIQGVPHYSLIEQAAHELGQELGRMVQQRHMAEVVAQQTTTACCPTCQTRCDVKPRPRPMVSIDGSVELTELVGHCPRCRRDFFPSASRSGL